MGDVSTRGPGARLDEDEEIDLSRVNVPGTRRDIEEVLRKKIAPDVRRLVEVARSLDIKPRMLPDLNCNCCDCKDPNRPNFGPNQVRHLCQIKKGLTYARVTLRNSRITHFESFTVTCGPYSAGNIIDNWGISNNLASNTSGSSLLLLAYCSVVPQITQLWEKYVYLQFMPNSEHLAGPHKDHCSCCRHHYREEK